MYDRVWSVLKRQVLFFSQSTTDPEAFTNSKLFVHQKVCILLVFVITNIQICLLTGTFAFSLSSFSLSACSGTQNCLWIRCFASLTGNVQMFEHFPFWQVMFKCFFLSNFFETVYKEVSVDREEGGGTVNFRQFLLATNMFKLNIFQRILKGFKFEEIMFMF